MDRETRTQDWWRLVAAVGFLVAVVAAAAAMPAAFADRLPDPVATHWDINGRVDGTAPRSGLGWRLLATMATVTAVLSLLAGFLAWRRRRLRFVWAPIVFVGGVLGSVALAASAMVVAANLDASSAAEAAEPSAIGVLATVLSGLAGAVIMAWTLGPFLRRTMPHADGDEPPPLDLVEGQRSVWIGHASNRSLRAAGAVLATAPAVVGMALGFLSGVAVVFVVAGLTVVLFGDVRVIVTGGEVSIGLGPLRWPRRTMARSNIDHASVVDVRPRDWGGWGWRGLPGRSAIVVRRGEGLELHTRAGGTLIVTVDDARRGAALINTASTVPPG